MTCGFVKRYCAYTGVLAERAGLDLESAGYLPSDPAEKRSQAALRVKEIVQAKPAKKKPGEAVAVAPANPPSKAKDEIKDSAKEVAVQSIASVPAPSIAPPPGPAVAATVPGATEPQIYPSVMVVVWMCRWLAVLVLLAEVAGAVNMLRGEWGRSMPPADKKYATVEEPSVEEQVERILARKAGQSSEITRLFAGAVCGVALLFAAEIIVLVVRVEQKLDHLSRIR